MPGGRSGLFPGIERLHQSAEYKQREVEDELLRSVGRDRLLELAKAEKDGLTPGKIENLKRALDAAAKLLTGYGHCTHYPGYICDKGFTTPGVCEVCIKEHLLGREKAKEG